MTANGLKSLLDVCFTAKHIVETMPELPKGMRPRHIHVLEQVEETCLRQGECRVSDVSTRMNITMPSITKLIQEMEAMGMVEKRGDKGDKRVSLLKLTDKGAAHVKKYVRDFHRDWVKNLEDISDDQVREAVEIIEKLHDSMPGRQEEM